MMICRPLNCRETQMLRKRRIFLYLTTPPAMAPSSWRHLMEAQSDPASNLQLARKSLNLRSERTKLRKRRLPWAGFSIDWGMRRLGVVYIFVMQFSLMRAYCWNQKIQKTRKIYFVCANFHSKQPPISIFRAKIEIAFHFPKSWFWIRLTTFIFHVIYNIIQGGDNALFQIFDLSIWTNSYPIVQIVLIGLCFMGCLLGAWLESVHAMKVAIVRQQIEISNSN